MLGVDPCVSTPKKANSKPKRVTIKEPFVEEQPKKQKATGVLKVKGKQQSSKTKTMKFKKAVDPIIEEEAEVVVETEDEETNSKVQETIQHTNYNHEANPYDVDQMKQNNPYVSPWRDAYVNLNIKETRNLDVTANTYNVEKTSRLAK